jgi:hypothetical protein
MRRAIPALIPALIIALLAAAPAFAKLPAPSDEAKAKAAEAALKTAWADKVGAFQLCRAMDHAAEAYRKGSKAAGKEPPAAVETPACADPGPFVAPVAAPPLEASGAHSPATMAVSPPGSKTTSAELQGQPKK